MAGSEGEGGGGANLEATSIHAAEELLIPHEPVC